MAKSISLTRYLVEQQRVDGLIPSQLRLLLEVVARACKSISHAVNKGALGGVLGTASSENVQGEIQKKLDIIANEVLKPDGDRGVEEGDFLQPGTQQVAAGYCIYGPQTTLVLTVGDGVAMFTLDREQGSFVLTEENVRIPEDTKEFAINMSNMRHWDEPVKRYIDECLQGKDGPRGKDFNMRWIASMVADVHRILTRGGVFMYPWDKREPNKPGKLRLMYEANPMGWLVEQAGGAATNGKQRILDIQPTQLHERVSVILGSKNEVERVTSYHSTL